MLKSIRIIQENECKWRISCDDDYTRFIEQAKQLGADVSEPRTVNIFDQYLDTQDRYFHFARTCCRLRSIDGKWELTFKDSCNAENNIFRRMEKTFELPDLETESAALEYCQTEILLPILKGRRVIPLFSLTSRRETRELVYAGGIRAESSLDEIEMQHLNHSVPARELELELLSGNEQDFSDLVMRLTQLAALQPINDSRFDQAIESFGIVNPAYNNATYQFDRHASVEKAAREIVRRDLQVVRDSEPAVRVGVYHDAIHDMRVACRRIRTALKTFKSLLPESAVSKEVAWLGTVLGRGRDLEVQMITLKNTAWLLAADDRVNLQRYWQCLSQRFEKERSEILQTLNSTRYAQLLQALEDITLSPPQQGNRQMHLGKAGGRMIGQALKEIYAKYPRKNMQQTDKSLHRLRIALKRIRYLCEFFSHVSSAGIDIFIRKTKVLQKILGDHQDLVTGIGMVKADSRKTDDQAVRNSLEKLAAKLQEGKATQQASFREAWQRF